MTIQLDTITYCAIQRGTYAEKCPDLISLDSDGEESSYYDSDTDSDDDGCTERRVSFATKLVTQVKTRPRTSLIERKQLFYTSDEYDR